MIESGGTAGAVEWEKLRQDHPTLQQVTYLNTPSCGAMARSTGEVAIKEEEQLILESASRFMHWMETGSNDVRKTVAKNLGTAQANIALVPGFSKGIGLLAAYLGHRPKVLLIKGDYPTLLAPFQRGPFTPVFIEPNADGSIPLSLIEEAILGERPDIVAISQVQWSSGYAIELKAFADLCRKHKALSVVDITQSWCCVPINVSMNGVDVLGGSGYKWPLAGFGNGFIYLADQVRDEISRHGEVEALGQLMLGHIDPVSFYRLNDALLRYERIGAEAIAARVDELCDRAVQQLARIGITLLSGGDPSHRAGILMLDGGKERLAQMESCGVQGALRGAGIRVGLHYYNNEEDIDRLVAALK